MSEQTTDRLYNLLPAVYRMRDQESHALRALLVVLESQLGEVEKDIEDLYENWFIETCEEWVVPYIGDLLGVKGLHAGRSGIYSLRALVANTLAYRRGKGTVRVIEDVARDSTGWDAKAVEFFELLSTTQHLNHVRPHNLCWTDLRDGDALERLDTAFDSIARTPDMRRIAIGRGKHNIPNVGVFAWRLQSYYLKNCTARTLDTPSCGRYTFNPLGWDAPLFNRPQTEKETSSLTREFNVAAPLRRRPLQDEIAARRDGKIPEAAYLGGRPVFQIRVDGEKDHVQPEDIVVCDLHDWKLKQGHPSVMTGGDSPTRFAVDPILGRLAYLENDPPEKVHVSYAYGFSGDVGGGTYNRSDSLSAALDDEVTWHLGVSKAAAAGNKHVVSSLKKAINQWHTKKPGTTGVIAIMDNATYEVPGDTIKIPAGSSLIIVAAGWPENETGNGEKERTIDSLNPKDLRPHLKGDMTIKGTAPAGSNAPGRLTFDGLLIEGDLKVLEGTLGTLRLSHCTLVSGSEKRLYATENAKLNVHIYRSICETVKLTDTIQNLSIVESIVDKDVDAKGAEACIEKTTVMGKTDIRSIQAGNSIFVGRVLSKRTQVGCVRYCYLPENSKAPRRFRCQPEYEIASRIEAVEKILNAGGKKLSISKQKRIRSEILGWLIPVFTSTRFGDPRYAQLADACPTQISAGTEDGGEMGVFNPLMQPRRKDNLKNIIDEYLRFGLEAGIIYVT